MKLTNRFYRLTFWNKVAVIGALASILALVIAMIGIPSIRELVKDEDTYQIEEIRKKILFKKDSAIAKEINFPMKQSIYDINYPKIIYNDNTYIQEKINKLIRDVYLEWDINITQINKSGWDGEIRSNYSIIYKIKNLLGIRFNVYWYGMGAAHGNGSIIALNINLQNGEIFEFKDLFREWALESINSLIGKKILLYKKCNISPQTINVRGNQGFYIEKDRIVIVFDTYEIASGSCGPIEIPLYFHEIKDFINPNGPLAFL